MTIALLLGLLAAAGNQSSRLNLIAIVTDDQGAWALGASGNPDIRTPNLDRMAAEGARFSNAFSLTPVCSPSRATYLTGLWPTEHGISDYLHPSETGCGIRHPTWPAALQAAGYWTGLVGKWHLGQTQEFHPTKHGFDTFVGFVGGGAKPRDAVLEKQGRESQFPGFLSGVLTDEAIALVREHRDRPFALCLHYRSPHLPYKPVPREDRETYAEMDVQVPDAKGLDREQLKNRTRDYYASITEIDRGVGRLLACLKEEGVDEKTIVLFCSDHGYNEGRHLIDTKGNGHWMAGGVRGPKRPNMWDTSLRIPLIVRGPVVTSPGMTVDTVVSTLDMYRTVLGILGVALPQDAMAHGRDISPALRGEMLAEGGPLFGQYDLHNGGLAYMRMIRTEDYKYVRHYKARLMDELYDLRRDPGETKNLIRNNGPELPIAEALRTQLLRWQESIGDPVLGANPPADCVRHISSAF